MTAHTLAAEPRAALAAFLSFLFPGLGQAYNRQARLAALLGGPIALVLGMVLLGMAIGGRGLLSMLLDQRFLIGLLVLDLALLGWRLVAVLQAHARRDALHPSRWTAWVTGLLVVITLGMHLLPAWYTVKAIDTLGSVAAGGTGGFGDDLDDLFPVVSGAPTPSAVPEGTKRINILLVGIDSLPGRVTALTDTMLVVSLSLDGGPSAMISIPRDLYGVLLPDGTPFNRKLNSLMTYAAARPDSFPLGGVGTLKATIGGLLGIPIHYFAAVKMLGFKSAIDALGGVDVTVTRAVNDPTYWDEYNRLVGFTIQPGTYHMDGHLALAYVRSRKGAGDSDFTRAERQQQLLAALQQQLTAGNLLLSLPGLLDAVKDSLATDVPGEEISDLAQAVQAADVSQLRRLVLQPPDHMRVNAHSSAGYILIPDLDAIRAAVALLLAPESSSSVAP
jgi:LCP family protein required for cell wall assembly